MAGISKEDLLEVLQDKDAGGGQSQGSTAAINIEQKQGDRDSWKVLYRALITSLQQSSAQFQALSFEALTLGLWGLSSAHATVRDDLAGHQIGINDRNIIKEFIYFGEWARAFEAGKTATELAAALCVQESDIVVHQPDSQALLPAHLVAVDHPHRQLLLVVRGTSHLADALTDLVAHTSPLGHGQAHSGMLECANAIIELRLPAIEMQLQRHPGYRIHCIGHSLGGGVAALAAYLLRNTPELCSKLSAAGCSGVVATGFGTPPVMTQQLAEAASGYTRTLVHNHDLVPRTCVASLAALRRELEQHTEAAFANNSTMKWLQDSGVIAGGKTLLAGAVTYAVANTTATKVAGAFTRSAGMQRFMATGLQVGAALLADKMKELHTDAVGEPVGVSSATFTTVAANSSSSSSSSVLASSSIAVTSTPAAPTASPSSSSSSASKAAAAAAAEQAKHLADHAAAAPAAVPRSSSTWGGLAALKQAAAAATAAAATRFQQQQQQLPQYGQTQVAAGGYASKQQQQQEEEEEAAEVQAAGVMLQCPGQLFYLKRTGEDMEAKYELIRKEHGAAAAAAGSDTSPSSFGRIIINQSMLRDHYLSHYITGLHKLELQLLEAMSLKLLPVQFEAKSNCGLVVYCASTTSKGLASCRKSVEVGLGCSCSCHGIAATLTLPYGCIGLRQWSLGYSSSTILDSVYVTKFLSLPSQ